MLIGAAHARMTRGVEGGAVWTFLGSSDSRSKHICWVSPVSGAGKSAIWRTIPLLKAVGQWNGQAMRHGRTRYRPEPYGPPNPRVAAAARSYTLDVRNQGARE